MEARDIKEIDAERLELIRQMEQLLSCPCRLFRPAEEDDELTEAYREARQRGAARGFTPVLVHCDDLLLESIVEAAGADTEGEGFSQRALEDYRRSLLATPLPEAESLFSPVRAVTGADRAAMAEGGELAGFSACWDERTGHTDFVLLAELPVKNPWEVFAWLPMGGWNACPGPLEMMAMAKVWAERYGAWPAAVSHDTLDFALPAPAPEADCLTLAAVQARFCPERVSDCGEGASLGRLAGDLARSAVWTFFWD